VSGLEALAGWSAAVALLGFALLVLRLEASQRVAIALAGATVSSSSLLWWLGCPQLAAALLIAGSPLAALLAFASQSLDVPRSPSIQGTLEAAAPAGSRSTPFTRGGLVQGMVALATLLVILLAALGISWRTAAATGAPAGSSPGASLAEDGLLLLGLAACLLVVGGTGCTIVLASRPAPPSREGMDREETAS
jgi:NADH:ubiquinone oxidoreductase subunit 6 (subunit J)